MNVKKLRRLSAEKLKNWKESQPTIVLNPEDIIITEPIHIKAKQINLNGIIAKYLYKTKMNKVIVVRELKFDNKYSLVMGLKWLMVAKLLNLPINCIIEKTGATYERFKRKLGLIDNDFKVPEGTEDIYPIDRVNILDCFQNTTPRKEKYRKYKNYFIKNGCIDKPITVIPDKFNEGEVIVVDEYIRYLVLTRNGIKYIPVKFQEQQEEN